MNVALRNATGLPALQWWDDPKMVSLVKRTAAKDCNADEFDEFVAVAKELKLNPLRKQIYAFVFSKADPEKRNMVIVVGIDGGRSIAARSGNYRPDDQPPTWEVSEEAKNPLTNPHGIVSCTVGAYHRPTKNDPFVRIVAKVFWDEFAPIVTVGDPDAYEWVGTGQFHPAGHKRAGEEKMRKQLKPGASAQVESRLDPKKEQWIKLGRHKISLCTEMQVLRRGWPDDMSRVYVEEETDRAHTLNDVEYSELTPSEMVAKADADNRLDRIGGPAILAAFDEAGTLERVEFGKFADRVMAHTEKMLPSQVKAWLDRNGAALNEFWAHNKTDCLALKKVLEARSGSSSSDTPRTAPAAGSPSLAPDSESRPRGGKLSKDELIASINKLGKFSECLTWAENHRDDLDALDEDDRREVVRTFTSKQGALKRLEEAKT